MEYFTQSSPNPRIMNIKLFAALLALFSISTFASCHLGTATGGNEIPVDIVFEKWNYPYPPLLSSIDVTLSGKNKSGEAVEVKTTLPINQYDEFLLPMLVKLEEKGEIKEGNTGAGSLRINPEFGNGILSIKKVGNVATKDMEFRLDQEDVSVFQ